MGEKTRTMYKCTSSSEIFCTVTEYRRGKKKAAEYIIFIRPIKII